MEEKRSLFFDTGLIYFVVIACFVGLRIFSSLVPVSDVVGNLLSVLIQVGFMLLIPFFMYKFMRKKQSVQVLKEFHVKKVNAKAILIAIGIGIIVYFLNLAVANFFNIFIFATGYDPSFGMASTSSATEYSWVAFMGDIIITAILPGICEEFCHRGLLVNGFKQIGPKRNIMLIGLLFGLMHLNIEQFFYATIIGMFLTFLVYLTDSIIPSIIVHFLNNAIGLYLTFAQINKLPFGDFSSSLQNALTGNPVTVFIGVILAIVILVGLLIFLTFMLLKQTRVNEFKLLAQKAFEKKQREMLLESFDIDVEETNKEQGIVDAEETQVVIGNETVVNGRRNVFVDFNFDKNNLLVFSKIKPTIKEKSFVFGTIFIGIFITISTLIWGIL